MSSEQLGTTAPPDLTGPVPGGGTGTGLRGGAGTTAPAPLPGGPPPAVAPPGTAPPGAGVQASAGASAPAGVPVSAGASAAGKGRAADQDWTFAVAARIESTVGAVRNKTTVPVTRAAKALVLGLVAATGGIVALVLFVIALVRLIDVYLPVHPYARRVWVVYAGLGAIFMLVGMFLWSKRKARKP